MEELSEKKKQKYNIIRIILQSTILALFLGIFIWATIKLYPIFTRLQTDEAYRDFMIEKIQSYG